MSTSATIPVLVGTYTPTHGEGKGVLVIELDTEQGILRQVSATGGIANPSFVTVAPDHRFAYAVSEVMDQGGSPTGGLTALALGERSGEEAPRITRAVETGSRGPCHVAVTPDGRHAVVANYAGGAVSVIELGGEAGIVGRTDLVQHEGHGVDPDRQDAAHAHSSTFDPSGDRVLVCDLGLDKVFVYQVDGHGKLTELRRLGIPTPAGTGPRHLDFDPDGSRLFVAGELASTLLLYAYDPATGEAEHLQTATTLAGVKPAERNYPADIHVHPTGRFVYVSNRGHDSLAIFGVDDAAGRVTPLGHQPTGGQWPRNFAIDPSGHLLLAANERSNTIVPFWIDGADGSLRQAAGPLEIGSPVCLRWLVA
ncbi:MAG: lactonase family protein [Candidatus Dormiibacterota bacterium]